MESEPLFEDFNSDLPDYSSAQVKEGPFISLYAWMVCHKYEDQYAGHKNVNSETVLNGTSLMFDSVFP